VTIDVDGLWPAHSCKENGFVPWHAICGFKERQILQRFELLGSDGTTLMRLEYQLSGFETLRSLVIEKTAKHQLPNLPAEYSKPFLYHVFEIVGAAGFALLGVYLANAKALLGYMAMGGVVLIMREYLTTIYRLVVYLDRIEIHYPFRTRRVSLAEVTAVKMGDTFNGGSRRSHVEIFVVKSRKHILLKNLGVQSASLYQVLSQLRSQNAPNL
jgi:hypothetical protein